MKERIRVLGGWPSERESLITLSIKLDKNMGQQMLSGEKSFVMELKANWEMISIFFERRVLGG